MKLFASPYLHTSVELTDERAQHIAERHPDLLPQQEWRVVETLAAPDMVRRSARFHNARLFSRWYNEGTDGAHVVVVVVSDLDAGERHWIITAYQARRLPDIGEGGVEWKRS